LTGGKEPHLLEFVFKMVESNFVSTCAKNKFLQVFPGDVHLAHEHAPEEEGKTAHFLPETSILMNFPHTYLCVRESFTPTEFCTTKFRCETRYQCGCLPATESGNLSSLDVEWREDDTHGERPPLLRGNESHTFFGGVRLGKKSALRPENDPNSNYSKGVRRAKQIAKKKKKKERNAQQRKKRKDLSNRHNKSELLQPREYDFDRYRKFGKCTMPLTESGNLEFGPAFMPFVTELVFKYNRFISMLTVLFGDESTATKISLIALKLRDRDNADNETGVNFIMSLILQLLVATTESSSVDYLELMQAKVRMLQDDVTLRKEFLETLSDLVQFLIGMLNAKHMTSYIHLVAELFRPYDQTGNMENFISGFTVLVNLSNLFQQTDAVPKTEGRFADAANFIDSIGYSDFFSLLSIVWSSCVHLKVFPIDVDSALGKMFTLTTFASDVMAVKMLAKSAFYILDMIEDLLDPDSPVTLHSLLFGDKEVSAAMDKADELISQEVLVADEPLRQGFISKKKYLVLLTTHVTHMESIMHRVKRGKKLSTYKLKMQDLKAKINSLAVDIHAGERFVPVFIVVAGLPGIGKSKLIKMISQKYCKMLGVKYSDNIVFSKAKGSPYNDTLTPDKIIFKYSELFATAPSIVKTKGDEMFEEVTSIVDSVKVSMNVAAAEDKGKIFATPLLVIGDTNQSNIPGYLGQCFTSPAAYLRRMIIVTPSVREEYVVDGGCELDKTKVGNGFNPDIWHFKVSNFVARSNADAIEQCEEFKDWNDFSGHLEHVFSKHINQQHKVMSSFDDYLDEANEDVKTDFVHPVDRKVQELLREAYPDTESGFVENLVYISVFASILGVTLSIPQIIRTVAFFKFMRMTADAAIDAKTTVGKYYVKSINYLSDNYRNAKSYLLSFSDLNAYSYPFDENRFCMTGQKTALGASMLVAILGYFMFRNRVKRQTEGSVLSVEDEISASSSYPRVKTQNHEIWNRIYSDFSPLHKGHHNVSPLNIRSAKRRVRILGLPDGRPGLTQMLGIKEGFFLIHKHALGPNPELTTLQVYQSLNRDSPHVEIVMAHVDYRELYDDVIMVRTPLLRFQNMVKHLMPKSTILPANADVVISDYATRVVNVKYNCPAADKYKGVINYETMVVYPWPDHEAGRCGEPLIMHVGNGQAIYGIHTAGHNGTGHAIPIYKDDVEKLIEVFPSYYGPSVTESGFISTTLEEGVGPRSPFKYENFENLRLLGRLPGFVMANQKSRLKRTIFSEHLPDIFDNIFGERPDIRYFPPLMKPITGKNGYLSPYNVGLRKLNRKKVSLDSRRLRKVIRIVGEHLSKELSNVPQLSPLTIDTVINGASGDDFISSMRTNTSPGFGWKGKKSDLLPLYDSDDPTSGRYVTEELNDKIVEYFDQLNNFTSTNTIYAAKLKDEPLPIEKVREGKTRIFYPQPIESLIVGKMLLLPFYSLMVEHSLDFGSAIGINAHQTWDKIMREMIEFSPHILEGDFSSYDMSIPVDIKMAAVEIIINFLGEKGYNEQALKLCRAYLTDNLMVSVELLNDVFQVTGLQPSGKDGTAEDNSLCNLLLWVYFAISHDEDIDFFNCVKLLTYGDDVLISVRPEVSSWFTGRNFQKFCASDYNMKFTTADKSDEMTDFISIKESSFLKRGVVWSDEFQRYIAPLKINSMYKMLEWRIPSPFVTDEEQYIAMCTSFLWESFFHLDLHKHDQIRFRLEEIIKNTFEGSCPNLPSYGVIKTKLGWTSVTPQIVGQTESGTDLTRRSVRRVLNVLPESKNIHCPRAPVQNGRVTLNTSSSKNTINEERTLDKGISSREFISLNKNAAFGSTPSRIKFKEELRKQIEENQLALLNSKITKRFLFDNYVVTESGNDHEMKSGSLAAEKKNVVENFEDHAGSSTNVQYSGLSRYANFGQKEVHGMENFLKRPVELTTFLVPVAAPADVSVQLKVWDTITLEPSIRAKLRNFAYLHTDLKITINVSGTPFHYGKLLVSYQPYPGRNDPLQALLQRVAVDAVNYRPLLLNYLSQSPGSIVIDLKENKPVEMNIPFISHKPMFRLFNDSGAALTDVTSYEDIEGAGTLFIYTINQAGSVSSAPSDVSVMVYGRMTNPFLGTLTATQVQVTTESGLDDEEKTGPIQKWSSAAAQYAGYLSYVPALKPFATPVEMVASGIAGIASIFGWSRPILTENVSMLKRIPMANGAIGIGNETAFKLSLDPKQALSIDGAFAGCGDDELVINYLSARESYLTTFTWEETDAPLSVPIFKSCVTPELLTWYNTLGRTYYQPTALAMTAFPFTYWTGSITFRIEVVCSAYHRGKLSVVYEPNLSQNTAINLDVEPNKQYMVTMDLQDTQSVDFCVSWASSRPWLKLRPLQADTVAYRDAYETINMDEFVDYANGYIRVVPFTRLQSPDSSSVQVNVYVKSMDIKYAGPSSVGIPSDRNALNTESGEDLSSMDVSCIDINESSYESKNANIDFFGESYPTFRTLLKRYQSYPSVANNSNGTYIQFQGGVMPTANPAWDSSSTVRAVPLFEYLRFAYLGIKGSMRSRFEIKGNPYDDGTRTAFQPNDSIVVQFDDPTSALETDHVTRESNQYYVGLTPGVQFTNTSANGIEADFPFMSSNLYHYAFASDYNGASINDSEFENTWFKNFRVRMPTFGTGTVSFTRLISTGEDFNLVRFQGAPPFTVVQA